MRKILLLTAREYKATVRTKGFIIGLILAPILMSGSLIAMKLTENQVDTRDRTMAVLDWSGVVTEELRVMADERNRTMIHDPESGKQIRPIYIVEPTGIDSADISRQRFALSEKVRNRELHSFLEIGPGVLSPEGGAESERITYHAENPAIDDMRGWSNSLVNMILRKHRLETAGVGEEEAEGILTWTNVESMGLLERNEETGAIEEAKERSEAEAVGLPMALILFMFLMVMMGAIPLLNSVMEEKTQRIAEVVLGSVRPFEFMTGKILGGVAVSLTAAFVYLAVGSISLERLELLEYLPVHLVPWIFTFMIMSIIMMGASMASLGAACNDPKDAQSLTMPAMFPVIIPMFVMVPVLKEPLSLFSTVMSLFPPFTPMLMLVRMAAPGGVPAWQPWAGLAGVILLSILVIWLGGRIFRMGILMQGQTPSFSLLVRWAVKG